MCEDKYIYSQIMTVGGLGGTAGKSYVLESPFSGASYEFAVMGVSSGDAAGQYQAIVSGDQDIPNLLYDGSTSLGQLGQAPFNFLKGFTFRLGPTQSLPPADAWQRVANGSKYVFLHAFTPAASAIFVAIQFRFLPVRVIPPRVTHVPPEAEDQINIARSEKIINRLELDVEKGDEVHSHYGRLR